MLLISSITFLKVIKGSRGLGAHRGDIGGVRLVQTGRENPSELVHLHTSHNYLQQKP